MAQERKQFDENMKDLMDKLFQVESNLEKANAREDRVLEQKARLINEVKDKEAENQDLRKRLYQSENKMQAVMTDLNQFIESLKRDKQGLNEENERLRGELKDKDADIEDLEQELQSQNGGKFKLRRMDTTMEFDMNIKKQQQGLEKERANQLEKLVRNLENELEKMRRDETNARERESNFKDEISELQRQVKQEQRKNDNLQNDIEALEEDLRFQIDMREEQETVKQAGMNMSIIHGRKEMVGLSEKVKKLAQENRKLLDDLERVRGEREVWKDRGAEVEDEVVLKNKEIEILNRKQLKNHEEMDKIKDLLSAKNKELEERRQNEEALRLEGLKLGDERMKSEGARLLAEKERDHMRKLAETDRVYLKEDLDKKDRQIAGLKTKLKELQIEADDLEFKVYNLEKKVKLGGDVEAKLKSNLEVKDAKIEDLKSQIDYLKKQIVAIESQESLSKMDLE